MSSTFFVYVGFAFELVPLTAAACTSIINNCLVPVLFAGVSRAMAVCVCGPVQCNSAVTVSSSLASTVMA